MVVRSWRGWVMCAGQMSDVHLCSCVALYRQMKRVVAGNGSCWLAGWLAGGLGLV